MSNEDVTAAAQKVKGSVKEAIGKLTGNAKIEREGAAEKSVEPGEGPIGTASGTVTPDITNYHDAAYNRPA